MKKKIIAIDNGKMNLKAKCGDNELCYLNKYSKILTDDENLLGKDTYNVTYRGKNFTIGANGKTSDRNEGKASEVHIVQALTAITRFIEPECKEDLYIMYGESVDMYFNNKHKIDIKTNLEGKHNIYVNGIAYNFNIEYVQILPEGIGHILQDLEKYAGVQYVVDIGGGTINFLKVVNGRPEPDSCRSFLLGVNNIISEVQTNLKRNGYGAYEEDLIRQYLTTRECPNASVLKKMDELVIEQLERLDDTLAVRDINIHNLLKVQPVMFIGGGAELFKEHINKYYKSDVIDDLVVTDALKANVRGFYEYGIAKFA